MAVSERPARDRRAEHQPGAALLLQGLALLAAFALALLAVEDPARAALVLGMLLVLVFCVVRVETGLLLLVASAPLEGATELPLTRLAAALCFGAFLLHAVISSRRLHFDASHVFVLLLLCVALASTAAARDPGAAQAVTFRYAGFVALYFIVTQFVGAHGTQKAVVWTLSLASAVAGVLAVESFLSGETTIARLPASDPNDLAYVLATTLPLTFWLLRERWAYRVLVFAMIGAISAAIVLSFSRGALLGLGAAFVWHLATSRRHVPAVIVGAIVTLLATILVVKINPQQVETGFQYKRNVAASNVESRLSSWSAAAGLAGEHPVLGVGPGNFRTYYPERNGIPPGVETVTVVHNAYLDIAAELGLGALLLFLMYLWLAFTRVTTAIRRGLGEPGFATALRTAIVVAMVGAITLSEQYFAPLWLLGALATALWTEQRVVGEAAV